MGKSYEQTEGLNELFSYKFLILEVYTQNKLPSLKSDAGKENSFSPRALMFAVIGYQL